MESNSSIMNRGIVGLDDCCTLGSTSDITIDCKTRSVEYVLFLESDGKTKRALPFSKVINVGDTFIVVQSSKDLIDKKSVNEKNALSGFCMLECPVYSKAGDKLGIVSGFEFDTVSGNVSSITLDSGSTFNDEQFIFFTPELIFVQDGTELRADLNAKAKKDAKKDKKEEKEEKKEPDAGDLQLISYLVGNVVHDDIVSEDGSFEIKKGTELTEELVQKAYSLDMLIALTMAVE